MCLSLQLSDSTESGIAKVAEAAPAPNITKERYLTLLFLTLQNFATSQSIVKDEATDERRTNMYNIPWLRDRTHATAVSHEHIHI